MSSTIGRHGWHAQECRLLSVTRNGCLMAKHSIVIKLDVASEIGRGGQPAGDIRRIPATTHDMNLNFQCN